MTTLIAEVARRATETPDKPAFIFISHDWTRTVLTYANVNNLARKFASRLHKIGVAVGDVVCNTLGNSPERLITQIGALMVGCVDMNGQLSLADGADFIKSLNDASAKVIIYNPNDVKGAYSVIKDKIKKKGEDEDRDHLFYSYDIPSLEFMVPCILTGDQSGSKSLLNELREDEDETGSVFVDRGPEAISTYMCTSGTTGFFKLVGFNGEYPVTWGHKYAEVASLQRESIWLNDRPLGWLGGYPSTSFSVGCTRVVVDWTVPRNKRYANFYWDVIGKERCTESMVVPSLLASLITASAGGAHGHKLYTVCVGSGPLNTKILNGIGTVAKSVVTYYASTEAGFAAMHRLESRDDYYKDFLCGLPTKGSEIRIVDSDIKDLPASETGDILIKPALVCSGYINNEKADAETFLPGGWVRLGDRGYLDAEGRAFVLGRGKHAIMRGPFIVYPEELEFRIQQCQGLADVVVVGVPDEGMYEEICVLMIRETSKTEKRVGADRANNEVGIQQRLGQCEIIDLQSGQPDAGPLGELPNMRMVNHRGFIYYEVDKSHQNPQKERNSQATDKQNQVTEADVRDFCRNNLYLKADDSDFSPMPKYFIFVESFPTLSSGKLDRTATKDLARKLVADLEK